MARPTKQGIDYFPMDINLDNDDKLQMVIAEFGIKGEVIYIKLLGWIYGFKGYYTEWNEIEQLKFVKRVSYIDGASMNLINEVVTRCIKWGLFDQSVFNSFQILTSKRIQQTWLDASRKRKDRVIDEKIWLIGVNAAGKAEETRLIPPETTQSKENKRKEKESKGESKDAAPQVFQYLDTEIVRPPQAPTLEQVKEFFHLQFPDGKLAERFFHHHEGIGWRKGISPIMNWRSFANQWAANPLEFQNYGNKPSSAPQETETDRILKQMEIDRKNELSKRK